MSGELTPGDEAAEAYKQRERRHDVVIFGGMGAILGAIMGVWIWMKWDLRLRTAWLSDALDSWLGLVLVVALVSTAVGLLSAWLRHRFDPRVFFYTWWL